VVDVPAEIDAPQEAAGASVVGVEFVGVGARPDAAGSMCRRVLDDEVVGAVAVQVADADTVDALHVVSQRERTEGRAASPAGTSP
jgi:hypothetical protein